MTYLIDTCVMSEFVKKAPNPQVSQWFNQQPIEQLFLSSITIAEIKKGIYKIQDSQPERYQKLKIWLQRVEIEFTSHILQKQGTGNREQNVSCSLFPKTKVAEFKAQSRKKMFFEVA
jgi:predicted nucleic acid-binding protein